MTGTKSSAEFSTARRRFHEDLLAEILTVGKRGIPANADKKNPLSILLSRAIISSLGAAKKSVKKRGSSAGKAFEDVCAAFLVATFLPLRHIRPAEWRVGTAKTIFSKGQSSGIAEFDQYEHLAALAKLAKSSRELRAALDIDYLIKPDVLVVRTPLEDADINKRGTLVDESVARSSPLRRLNSQRSILHASISCKWTIRSDRVQNARSEALNLIKNRKGKLPHVAVVTAEPLPSRIAAIALGTGEVDCVYHFALPELIAAVNEHGNDDTKESLQTMIDGKRLRDISDLPLDLAI